MTHRRIYWMIGVEYRTTVPQLRRIRDEIEDYVLTNPAFADPSEVSTFVRIDRFGESSIDIMLYCFTITTNWGEWLEVKEALAYKIKEIVEGAGSGFAFPSRSLYVEALPGGPPEPFVLPEGTPADIQSSSKA
jgi:MscS family membrane protein